MNAYTLLKNRKENREETAQRELDAHDRQYIAKTIISQIRATDYWSLAAWGARNYVSLNSGNIEGIGYVLGGVMFQVNGAKVNRGGRVLVYLMGNDTYTVRVCRVRGTDIKDIKIVNDVYCDMLMNVIDGIIER